MKKETIFTKNAPAAVGPYSQAIKVSNVGETVYVSGQIPLDPETMKIVEGGVSEQADQVLKNLTAVLKEAGFGLADVVKCDIFVASMGDFAVVNKVYENYFGEFKPARATVEVGNLPLYVLVEISCIACK